MLPRNPVPVWLAQGLLIAAMFLCAAPLKARSAPLQAGADPAQSIKLYLEQATTGTILTVRGPQGGFTLQDNGLKPRWFVAGGTGLAPLLSMLRRMAEWQEPHPVRLYLGVNRTDDLFGETLLAELQNSLPALQIIRCVWQPGADWTGFCGTPADALAQDLPAGGGEQPDIYICGPSALVSAAEEQARARGIPDGSLFSERFLPAAR